MFGIRKKEDYDLIPDTDFVLWNVAVDHVVNKILTTTPLSQQSIDRYDLQDYVNGLIDLEEYYGEKINTMPAELIYRFLKEKVNARTESTPFSIPLPLDQSSCGSDGSESGSQDRQGGQNNKNQDGQNQDCTDQSNCNNNNKKQKQEVGNNFVAGEIRGKKVEYVIEDKETGKTIFRGLTTYYLDLPKSEDERVKLGGMVELIEEMKKSCGDIPGLLEKEFDIMKYPLDLSRELTKHLKIVKKGLDDVTFSKPSKMSLTMGLKISLPTFISRKVNVIVGVDTSGSISQEEYESFIGIILGNAHLLEGKVYLCDCEITKEVDLKSSNRSEIMTMVKKLSKRKGFGGTAFEPVFNKVKESKSDILIYFTDLFAPFPPKPNVDVLWVVKKSLDTMEVKPPYGRVVWF